MFNCLCFLGYFHPQVFSPSFSHLMFWRFGFHNASTLEGIIEKEGSSLNDLMDEEELLQEVKAQNIKLIEL